MRLLVQNRIAEFHTELEVLPDEVAAKPLSYPLLLRLLPPHRLVPHAYPGLQAWQTVLQR